MILIYRMIYFLLKLILKIMSPFYSIHLKKWIQLRDQALKNTLQLNQSYWFHASSGEIEYCKSIIRQIKNKNPQAQVVVTYSSPSAEKLFGNISDLVNQFIPIPWDQQSQLNPLFDYIKPKVLVFSRTDIWPEMLSIAKKRKIKTGVVSFNPKFNFLTEFFYKYFLNSLDFISCVDQNKAAQLKLLLPTTLIRADGDTRFDQVFFRLEQAPKVNIKSDKKMIVLGSTWTQDESVVLNNLNFFKNNNLNLILSPHEVSSTNVNRLEDLFKNNNCSTLKLSELVQTQQFNFTMNVDVLIIDQIGYLADCYRHADLAFIGGSFKDKVHSVMEPLCCGINVLVGPYYTNSPEAEKYLNQYVFNFKTADEFEKLILGRLNEDHSKQLDQVKLNKNASDRVLELILT